MPRGLCGREGAPERNEDYRWSARFIEDQMALPGRYLDQRDAGDAPTAQ
jgi:hypothetical protein